MQSVTIYYVDKDLIAVDALGIVRICEVKQHLGSHGVRVVAACIGQRLGLYPSAQTPIKPTGWTERR